MAVDPVALRHLYAQEGLSTTAVAGRLGCSPTTVRRRLRALGIAVRPRGPGPFSRSRGRPRRTGSRPRVWSTEIAYAIGLLATDGNLSPDRRHLAVSSKDRDLLETLRRCLGLRVAITPSRSGAGRWYWHLQWGDRLPIWCLKYGKYESLRLLAWLYHADDVPCLARKRARAAAMLSQTVPGLRYDGLRASP